MRNRARQFATAAAALAASVAPVPVAAEPPRPFEIFHGPDGVAGFVYPAATGAPRSPAVVIVHDALGIDARSHRYVAQLTEAGLIVLEVELRANPPDGVP